MSIDYRSEARINKDKSFDGQFFFGVKTTGIFCRPSCPAPIAKEENVLYFDRLTDALCGGFRPCLRCRPDIYVEFYNGNADGTMLVDKAITMIQDGYMNDNTVDGLASELGISSRQLGRLFKDNLGLSPIVLIQQQKAIFAKKLLMYSEMPITDIAFAAGFGSIRQFNDVFKKVFKTSPRDMRKEESNTSDSALKSIMIPYEQPFDYARVVGFMAHRSMAGVEFFEDGIYYRTFRLKSGKGHFSVENVPEASAVKLTIVSDTMSCYMPIYHRVRKMFDLDNNIVHISKHLNRDDRLAKGMVDNTVPRLPMAFNTFEFVIRAILGQQITVRAATTLAGRVAAKAGITYENSPVEGLKYFFPDLEEMLTMDLSDIGITKIRQGTIRNVLEALRDGVFSLDRNQRYEDFRKSFIRIKGIGEWTTEYIAMRGFGMVDSFPAMDLGIIKALTVDDKKLSRKEILEIAKPWQPYRAYAALSLWHSLGKKDEE